MAQVLTQFTIPNGGLAMRQVSYAGYPDTPSQVLPYPRGKLTIYGRAETTGAGAGDYDTFEWNFDFPQGFAFLPVTLGLNVSNTSSSAFTNQVDQPSWKVTGGAYEQSFALNNIAGEMEFEGSLVNSAGPEVVSTARRGTSTVFGQNFYAEPSTFPRSTLFTPTGDAGNLFVMFSDPGNVNPGGTWRTNFWTEWDVYDIEQVTHFPVNFTQRVL